MIFTHIQNTSSSTHHSKLFNSLPVDWSIGEQEVGFAEEAGEFGAAEDPPGMAGPENLRAALSGLSLFWVLAALALSPSTDTALAWRGTKCSGFEGRSMLSSPPPRGSNSILMGIWRRKPHHGTLPSPVRLPRRAHFPDFGGPQDSCRSLFEAVAIMKELLLHLQAGRGES